MQLKLKIDNLNTIEEVEVQFTIKNFDFEEYQNAVIESYLHDALEKLQTLTTLKNLNKDNIRIFKADVVVTIVF